MRFLIAVLLLGCLTFAGCYDGRDVRDACTGHNGVQQVDDHTWGAGKADATVVCKDGWAVTVG
jgi:hypothetical protein